MKPFKNCARKARTSVDRAFLSTIQVGDSLPTWSLSPLARSRAPLARQVMEFSGISGSMVLAMSVHISSIWEAREHGSKGEKNGIPVFSQWMEFFRSQTNWV